VCVCVCVCGAGGQHSNGGAARERMTIRYDTPGREAHARAVEPRAGAGEGGGGGGSQIPVPATTCPAQPSSPEASPGKAAATRGARWFCCVFVGVHPAGRSGRGSASRQGQFCNFTCIQSSPGRAGRWAGPPAWAAWGDRPARRRHGWMTGGRAVSSSQRWRRVQVNDGRALLHCAGQGEREETPACVPMRVVHTSTRQVRSRSVRFGNGEKRNMLCITRVKDDEKKFCTHARRTRLTTSS